jgi:hypothetical protein
MANFSPGVRWKSLGLGLRWSGWARTSYYFPVEYKLTRLAIGLWMWKISILYERYQLGIIKPWSSFQQWNGGWCWDKKPKEANVWVSWMQFFFFLVFSMKRVCWYHSARCSIWTQPWQQRDPFNVNIWQNGLFLFLFFSFIYQLNKDHFFCFQKIL